MATKYDSYSVFMAEVVKKTKERTVSNPFSTAWSACATIIDKAGWLGFLAVCALLVLGPIAFGLAIAPFFATPPGAIIVVLGGGALLWTLYRNKKLPLAVKAVGERYKSRYENLKGDSSAVDRLQNEVVDALFRELFM